MRANRLTGELTEWREGSVAVLPLLHETRIFALRDRSYRPAQISSAEGPSPLQSLEGLSLGVDLSVRYALDAARLRTVWNTLPDDISTDIVEPAVQGVIYNVRALHGARDLLHQARRDPAAIESEVGARFAADGLVLRGVVIGKVDLRTTTAGDERAPRRGARGGEDALHAGPQDKRVRKRARRRGGEGAPREDRRGSRREAGDRRASRKRRCSTCCLQAAPDQSSALEAEAEKVARIRGAEGTAEARQIEAVGEAQARQEARRR